MKLATFRPPGASADHVGVVLDGELADLTAVAEGPTRLLELLGDSDPLVRAHRLCTTAPRVALDEVTLRAPIPNPGKFLAIGMNSPEHRREVNLRWLLREPQLMRIAAGYALAHPRPRHPFFFAKATSSITGPYSPIQLPPHTSKVDWEGELAVVVGAHLAEADTDTARRAIAGYMITNDVSVRDWQTDNPTSAAMAKGYRTHGPCGPWLTTPDDAHVEVETLTLTTYLNGERRQHGRIADLTLSPAQILARLSTFCTLCPGDVIACGTFAGTGWPTGRFLRSGDRIRVEITGLGHLDNTVSDHTVSPDASPHPESAREDLR